ncbi:MAG: hypothetical protein A2521_00765 [Deltaproteobacteria bacterium RIFOXYD12_FULL_57_12]|nr:MAG: hypothetical protein A2521_00765 [Deltaproteobacteria bacterium RIFOXYD12_FULL_57_12]
MDVEKVYVRADDTATIKCPRCNAVKQLSVTNFKNTKKILKIKCACQEVFCVSLEFRKMYRKETKLDGSYNNTSKENDKNRMIVNNISMSGVGFTCIANHKIEKGDRLKVTFTLDDQHRSVIVREAVARLVQGSYIGCEFINVDAFDKYLGFYLRP